MKTSREVAEEIVSKAETDMKMSATACFVEFVTNIIEREREEAVRKFVDDHLKLQNGVKKIMTIRRAHGNRSTS